MNENLEQNLLGKGNQISLHFKKCVSIKYNQLKSMNPNQLKEDIISELSFTYQLSKSSIKKIIKTDLNGQTMPKKTGRKTKKFTYNDNDYVIIDQVISELNEQNISASIYDVFREVKGNPNSDLSFKKCGLITFHRIIKEMGYKYTDSNQLIRAHIIETQRIRQKLLSYLTQKLKYSNLSPGSEFVFIDESSYHTNDVHKKILKPIKSTNNIKINKTIGVGDRYSVIHAISENGFIENALKIVKNDTIDAKTFEEWAKNQLIPNLPPNAIVIFDNSSVHSRVYNKTPVKSSSKKTMREWLEFNKIDFNCDLKKKDLYKLVKENAKPIEYFFDKMLKEKGHFALRLPPFMCELNPIEMIWGISKYYVKKNNYGTHKQNFKTLIEESFKQIDSSQVAKTIRKVVRDVESPYLLKFNIIEIPINDVHNYSLNFIPTQL